LETIKKTMQFFQIIFLLLAIVVVWGAEGLSEGDRENPLPHGNRVPDDLTASETGSFIGS